MASAACRGGHGAKNRRLNQNIEARGAIPTQGHGLTREQNIVVERQRRISRRRCFGRYGRAEIGIFLLGEALDKKQAGGAKAQYLRRFTLISRLGPGFVVGPLDGFAQFRAQRITP